MSFTEEYRYTSHGLKSCFAVFTTGNLIRLCVQTGGEWCDECGDEVVYSGNLMLVECARKPHSGILCEQPKSVSPLKV